MDTLALILCQSRYRKDAMTTTTFAILTDILMAVVIAGLLVHFRRERRRAAEDAAARRGKMKHMTLDQLQRGYSPRRAN